MKQCAIDHNSRYQNGLIAIVWTKTTSLNYVFMTSRLESMIGSGHFNLKRKCNIVLPHWIFQLHECKIFRVRFVAFDCNCDNSNKRERQCSMYALNHSIQPAVAVSSFPAQYLHRRFGFMFTYTNPFGISFPRKQFFYSFFFHYSSTRIVNRLLFRIFIPVIWRRRMWFFARCHPFVLGYSMNTSDWGTLSVFGFVSSPFRFFWLYLEIRLKSSFIRNWRFLRMAISWIFDHTKPNGAKLQNAINETITEQIGKPAS